jgi:hypothetical protein
LRSHTFVLEDWHMPALKRRAMREKRTVSAVVRMIFDDVLRDGIESPDIDSLDNNQDNGTTNGGDANGR